MASNRRYKFGSDLQFAKSSSKIVSVLIVVLKLMGIALVVALVLYFLFALFVNTDTESRLKSENKMMEKVYPGMVEQEKMLNESISVLQSKDNKIYQDVFHTSAPNVNPIASLDVYYGSDSIPDTKIISYARKKSVPLTQKASAIEENFQKAIMAVADPSFCPPPMRLPLKNISYTQVGASKGVKTNPFYRAGIEHGGIDFIAPTGETVYATLDGVVSVVDKSSKGMGNMVTISHAGGYKTRYAHLSSISVKQGQKVEAGKAIGEVGMTGSAYAPHLHYEVLRFDEPLNPSGYIFASVSPEEYCNMLYMAVNTQQSMD